MKTTHILRLITGTLLTGLFLSSCSPKLYQTQSTQTSNTVTEKEIVRDTIIQIKPDSSMIRALIQCDSTGRARLQEIQTLRESARLQQSISIDQDSEPYKTTAITVQTKVDSMGIYLKYKERFKEETKIETIEKIITKETNILKPWQKFLMNIGAISIIVLLLYLTFGISKLIRKV